MTNKKIVVEIRAPYYGTVQDINIYTPCFETVKKIIGDIKDIAPFVHETKADIDDFELVQNSSISVKIRVADYEGRYDLGKAFVEATFGGLAYNTFQNLNALNQSLEDRLSLMPIIGLPRDMIQKLRDEGVHQASYFLPADVRKSLMIVSHESQLNLVTKQAALYEAPSQLEIPDVAVISSYPPNMNAQELDNIRQYKNQRPDLRLYFNPGSTQIRIGVQEFRDIMPLISVITMELNEAGRFLRIESDSKSRVDFARECLERLLEEGVRVTVLNDSRIGSYMGQGGKIYHTAPFPKRPIEKILGKERKIKIENFSGCGDGIFSGMLYSSEVYPDIRQQERLTFANALTRLISLIPHSNLYGINPNLIGNTLNISKSYADRVKSIS